MCSLSFLSSLPRPCDSSFCFMDHIYLYLIKVLILPAVISPHLFICLLLLSSTSTASQVLHSIAFCSQSTISILCLVQIAIRPTHFPAHNLLKRRRFGSPLHFGTLHICKFPHSKPSLNIICFYTFIKNK